MTHKKLLFLGLCFVLAFAGFVSTPVNAQDVIIIDPEPTPEDPGEIVVPPEEPPVVEPPVVEPPVVVPEEPPVVVPEEPPVVVPEEPPVVVPEEPPVVVPEEPPVIEPEPTPEEPPAEEPLPEEPPEEEFPPTPVPTTPPAPEQVTAQVKIMPRTINYNGNFHKEIMAMITLPEGYKAEDVDVSALKISAINGTAITPVMAITGRSRGIGNKHNTRKLMARFSASEFKAQIPVDGEALVTITATLDDGKVMVCQDTIRIWNVAKAWERYLEKRNKYREHVDKRKKYDEYLDKVKKYNEYLDELKKSNEDKKAREDQDKKDKETGTPANKEMAFQYNLEGKVPAGATLVKAVLWLGNRKGDSYELPALLKKKDLRWEQIMSRWARMNLSHSVKGDGCEWDVTGSVGEIWSAGNTEVLMKLDEKYGSRKPVLVVTYQQGGADSVVPVVPGKMVAVSPRVVVGDSEEAVTLFYDRSKLKGSDESVLAIYCWDESAGQWEQIPGSQVNTRDQSITAPSRGNRTYQILALGASASQQGGETVSGGPAENNLGQNYPNPFNPATTISYSVAEDCHVCIRIYSIAGELVATVVDEYQKAGSYSARYESGAELARGVYYYQLTAGGFTATKRMIVLR